MQIKTALPHLLGDSKEIKVEIDVKSDPNDANDFAQEQQEWNKETVCPKIQRPQFYLKIYSIYFCKL